jgi:hypothetical protein
MVLVLFTYPAGRPAKARLTDEIPINIGRSSNNTSNYHISSRFLLFTGAIADTHKNMCLQSLTIFKISLLKNILPSFGLP